MITKPINNPMMNSLLNSNLNQTTVGDDLKPFSNILADAISSANKTDAISVQDNYSLLTNDGKNLHSIIIDAEKADIALQFTLQIRNKLMDAYTEIMRMQI